MHNNPYVGIVTLNYNGQSHLDYFLRNALKIKYSNYDIVVVDNCSTDDSVSFIEKNYKETKLLKLDKNYGYAAGFNKGINYLVDKADYILITNNDVILHKNIIKEGVKTLESNNEIGYV